MSERVKDLGSGTIGIASCGDEGDRKDRTNCFLAIARHFRMGKYEKGGGRGGNGGDIPGMAGCAGKCRRGMLKDQANCIPAIACCGLKESGNEG